MLPENGIRQVAVTVWYIRNLELCAPPSFRKWELKLTAKLSFYTVKKIKKKKKTKDFS